MIITKRLFFVLVKGGVCCLRLDPFSTLAWRQRYVKDFIACKKLPFLLALRAGTFHADLPPRETSPAVKEREEMAIFAG